MSRTFSNHTLRGNSYNPKEKFIQVNLSFGLRDKEYYREYSMRDKTNKEFISNVKIYEFNMDKYTKLWYTQDMKKILDNKYLIMLNLPKEELEKFSKEDEEVSDYMDKLNRINEDPAFLNLIDYEEDNIRLINSEKEWIRDVNRRKGRREGRKEGRKEGREEMGIEIATNLIKSGMNLEDISKNTGVSLEKLKSLEERYKNS